MSELNPVQVEKIILEISNEMSRAIIEASDALENQLRTKRVFELAEARAYMRHNGPAHEKKYAAVIATELEAVERDAAEVAYRFIDRKARALEKKLSAYQTVGSLVKQAYAVAGRGEW